MNRNIYIVVITNIITEVKFNKKAKTMELKFKGNIIQIGNSRGVIIPKQIADLLEDKSYTIVIEENGRISKLPSPNHVNTTPKMLGNSVVVAETNSLKAIKSEVSAHNTTKVGL